jgi:hypothetical protein
LKAFGYKSNRVYSKYFKSSQIESKRVSCSNKISIQIVWQTTCLEKPEFKRSNWSHVSQTLAFLFKSESILNFS